MKKTFSLCICLMIVFLCISCSAGDAEIVPEYSGLVPDDTADLNGTEFRFGWDNDKGATLGYIEGTDFGDLAAKRIKDVENKYNCRITVEYHSGIGDRAYLSAVSGSYEFDAIAQATFGLVNYMRANAFQDLIPLQSLDVFDETKWGSRYMRMSTMFDGSLYSVIPAALPMRLFDSELGILCVNEDYVAAVQETDPRDYFENGEWNWDNFEYCLAHFSQTNLANEYVYSFSSGYGGFARDLALSNGNTFVMFKDNGTYELGYFTQSAIDTYNKCFDWFYGSFSSYVTDYWKPDLFISGGAVIYRANANQVFATTDAIAYQLENIGIVPMPVGPDASDPSQYRVAYPSGAISICIPLTTKDAETSALIIDRLHEPFEGYETKEDMIEYLSRYYFSDERDSKLMFELVTGPHTMYHDHHHGMSTMFDQIPEGGVVATVESYKKAIYQAAETYVISMYETLNELDGYFHD